MKIVHLETRYKKIVKLSQKQVDKLPKELALFSSIQFLDSLKHIKKQLEENKIQVTLSKGIHSKYKGQLLGCEVKKLNNKAFLYIGDGLFHPYALMLKNNKPTFAFNPFNKKLTKIKEKDIEKIKKRQKGALLKFLTAKEIGILVSTKPGQNRLKEAKRLEKQLKDVESKLHVIS